MSVEQNIIDALKNQGTNPDLAQIDLIKELCDIQIKKNYRILKIFSKQKNLGLYIWGDVGRGKTLIANEYLKQIKDEDTKNFHYIDFMNYVHNQLNNFSGLKNPLRKISKILCKNRLIFIDEFQVEDVADAMIVGDLLVQLTQSGTKIILTSNAHPNDLYKDGLQRQKFLKSINIFLKNISIHELGGEIDYRTRNIIKLAKNEDTIYSDEDISSLIKKNFGIDRLESNQVEINHRKFGCKLVSNNILWIEYSSFFKAPTGANDYKHICNKFDWIFISKLQSSDDSYIDIVRRFISFIDIAYVNQAKIKIFYNDFDINELYTGSKIDLLWNRCASRLSEMRTYEYLNNN